MAEGIITWDGAELGLVDEPYNVTAQNERAVEIAIARYFVARQHGTGLEVGNVLSHYGVTGHRVIDRYEEAEGVENVDFLVAALHPRSFDWAVCISTLEHIGWDDEREPSSALAALNRLRAVLKPGALALVSVPIGWHPTLDAAIAHGAVPVRQEAFYTARGDGTWRSAHGRPWRPYNTAEHRAEVVWVAEVLPQD